MECIDSLDLVENKDLLFLRGKDFYLVGQTDLFKTIELEWEKNSRINDWCMIDVWLNVWLIRKLLQLNKQKSIKSINVSYQLKSISNQQWLLTNHGLSIYHRMLEEFVILTIDWVWLDWGRSAISKESESSFSMF